MKSNQFSNLVYLPWLTGILKSPRCDIIDWHYDRGLNNSKLTVWSLITVADGGVRVWHFNGVITTYGKRGCRNSWRYASLAVNRGAIKRGFTVYCFTCQCQAGFILAPDGLNCIGLYRVCESLSGSCLTAGEQLFSYIMARASDIWMRW